MKNKMWHFDGEKFVEDSFDFRLFIPLLRKAFPVNIVKDLISVQPMSGPTGLAFNYEHKKKILKSNKKARR